MITINNNDIIFSKDEKYYDFLRRHLIKFYVLKNMNFFKYNATRTVTKYNIPEVDAQIDALNIQLRQRPFDKCDTFYDVYYIYNLDDNDNLVIPIGLMEFVKPFFSGDIKINYDLKEKLIDTNKVLSNLDNKILDGITLRDEQLKAVKLCLTLKRTIIQMATGAGKSEVMCAFIKSIQNELGECPTTLLLEPTDKLKNEMIERFQKYGINAVDYGKSRKITKSAINITHPMSLNNDLEKDKDLLKDIKVYMCDECLQNKSKVLLPNNKYVTIEEIYNNPFINEVMSYNLEKNIYEPKRIIRKIKSENQDRKCFYTIQYINPITNEINKLKCTGNHKIWTKNRGYVRADELTLNDEIKIDTNNGLDNLKEVEGKIRKFLFNHHIKPIKIYKSKGPKYKYNLEVEDNHNYWADGILVSNCHHSSAQTYMSTILNIPNAEYTIGVSASAISQEHIGEKNIAIYDINEIETMSMLGTVSLNITASDLINQSKLAKPVLLVINNPGNEFISKNKLNDWHEINKKRLQSPARTKQIAETSVFFSKRNRKTLILVNTKEYAYNIAKVINSLGLNDQCRLSFGGKVFLKYNSINDEFEKDDSDTFQDYRDGKISILIGTQHLVEGVDVPSLDVVILAYCGKSERIQIQSCGRVLRLTKNGNMAYIVDFSDEKDPILSYQFKTRLKNYLTTIGVNRNNVHVINHTKIDEGLSIIFNKYES